MRCVHCNRPMERAWSLTRAGRPVGPKCGRQLGLKRPELPKVKAVRLVRSRDDRQLDWIEAACA